MTTPCEDFSFFKEKLKALRRIDDNIKPMLNKMEPSKATCAKFFQDLTQAYTERQELIEKCSAFTNDRIRDLERKVESNDDLAEELDLEYRKRRLIRNEEVVEGIVKERTMREFNLRCRMFQ